MNKFKSLSVSDLPFKWRESLLLRRAWRMVIPALALMYAFASCNNNEKAKTEYNPNEPVVLTSFEPDSGRIREMVLLDGKNFGSDVSLIKVFFNKAEAKVIGSTGTRILALVPRLPGDTCEISVQIGDQNKAYENQKFRYKVEASVTTFAGNGSEVCNFGQGLDKLQYGPVFMAVDKDDNLIVNGWCDNADMCIRINIVTEDVQVLFTGANVPGFVTRAAPAVNPLTNVIHIGYEGENNRDLFVFLDPKDGWAPKIKNIKSWDANGYELPKGGGWGYMNYESHYGCLYCEVDGMYYTHYFGGQLVRINPATWEAKIIGMLHIGTTWGLSFHPFNKSELWIAYTEYGNSATVEPAANGLYTVNVLDETVDEETGMLASFKRRSSPVTLAGQHRDGPLSEAQFWGMRQIDFDKDGNLFIGDNFNNCIRQVDTKAMMVSTIIGIPGVQGFADGQKEEALFNQPMGLVVDSEGVIYIADLRNIRIRRVAIE